jgi:hypothetical protein
MAEARAESVLHKLVVERLRRDRYGGRGDALAHPPSPPLFIHAH